MVDLAEAERADLRLCGDWAADLLAPWRRPGLVAAHMDRSLDLDNVGFVPAPKSAATLVLHIGPVRPDWRPDPEVVAVMAPSITHEVAPITEVAREMAATGGSDADQAVAELRAAWLRARATVLAVKRSHECLPDRRWDRPMGGMTPVARYLYIAEHRAQRRVGPVGGVAVNGKVALFVLAMLATIASGPIGAAYGWAWGWVVTVVATPVVIWWSIRDHLRRRVARLTGLPVPDEVVNRPEQVDEVVRYLTGRRRGPVGITATTALTGAGGFGKTTLAAMVRADRRVEKHFKGGSLAVTIGQGVRGAALAAKINDLVEVLGEAHPSYTDPETAGAHLMGLLERRQRNLLIVDDVWAAEQLDPFRTDGTVCALLVTTRLPDVLPAGARRVLVDQMSEDQARQMITAAAPSLPRALIGDLVKVTGQWPLLLALVAGRLRTTAADLGDVIGATRQTVALLTERRDALDVKITADRTRAVSLNIGLSLDLLPPGGADRFDELGIFPEDTAIPISVVARLWGATADMSVSRTHDLCQMLGQLSLARHRLDKETIELHDVILAYLRGKLEGRLPDVHQALVDNVAASLPKAPSLGDGTTPLTAWWELPDDEPYLWARLAYHMAATKQPEKFDASIADLRWVGARLLRSGPVAPTVDLRAATDQGLMATERASALARSLARAAHLLTPIDPPRAVVDVLLSRLHGDPAWRSDIEALQATNTGPHLANRWSLPDDPEPALRRILTGHTDRVLSVAFSPDGTLLASAGHDRTVRVWVATPRSHAMSGLRTGDRSVPMT